VTKPDEFRAQRETNIAAADNQNAHGEMVGTARRAVRKNVQTREPRGLIWKLSLRVINRPRCFVQFGQTR
jgi:hypothetical protein